MEQKTGDTNQLNKDFDKLNDEFFFCQDNAEIKEILTTHGIKSW